LLRVADRLDAATESVAVVAPLRAITDPDERVPVSLLGGIWRNLCAHDSDPALGLRLGRHATVRDLGLVGYVMGASATLGQALDRLGRYYGILREGVECRMERRGAGAAIVLHAAALDASSVRQEVDARIAAILTICRELVGQRIVPGTVDLPYGQVHGLGEHRRMFGSARFRFDQSYGALQFGSGDLARAIRTADGTLARYLERLAVDMRGDLESSRSASFGSDVAHVLAANLRSGSASISDAAASLGLSDRTLQRRLRYEATTFTEVLEQVRRQEAERLLSGSLLPIDQVAVRLGYGESSTFYRAFHRWHGVTPGTFRSKHLVAR
jgi:AraC-like DNA-binding protein